MGKQPKLIKIPPDSMDFTIGELFGPEVIGSFFKNSNCSVAVVYKFNGELIDAQIFDSSGVEIKEEIIKEGS